MKSTIEKYSDALATGKVNGWGYIDGLTDGQIEILCSIITAITGKKARNKADVKDFTRSADSKTFDRYVKNVFNAHSDLVLAESKKSVVDKILEGADVRQALKKVSVTESKLSDREIKELVSTKLLRNISDAPTQTVLRRVLFYNKNKIDWQDLYQNMLEQMPELQKNEDAYIISEKDRFRASDVVVHEVMVWYTQQLHCKAKFDQGDPFDRLYVLLQDFKTTDLELEAVITFDTDTSGFVKIIVEVQHNGRSITPICHKEFLYSSDEIFYPFDKEEWRKRFIADLDSSKADIQKINDAIQKYKEFGERGLKALRQ